MVDWGGDEGLCRSGCEIPTLPKLVHAPTHGASRELVGVHV